MSNLGRIEESTLNVHLAEALRSRHPRWNTNTLVAERTSVLRDKGKRPDITVSMPGCPPVIVETEVFPARQVEQEAIARLGRRMDRTGQKVESAIAVILPDHLRHGDAKAVGDCELSYATFTATSTDNQNGTVGYSRFPVGSEWLTGNVSDLATAIEFLCRSREQLRRGTDTLEQLVSDVAGLLAETVHQNVLDRIAKELYQHTSEQTYRMMAAIWASAFVFHAAIEGQPRIPPMLRKVEITLDRVLTAWEAILKVNYWPIFVIATKLARRLPIVPASYIFEHITESISDLARLGATTYHDLCGRMFQTLISDRKFLATFYTLPSSSALLAEVAVDRLDVNWADREQIVKLRVGDFTCGTGALLSAAQHAIYRRYRRAGGDDADLHRDMMERCFIGLDIMPAATHLTCSMLSGAHPSIGYGRTQIHTMPYGRVGEQIWLGSLEFLWGDHFYSLFETGAMQLQGMVDGDWADQVVVANRSCDLVIMNPPFTRNCGQEAQKKGVPAPAFAGFDTPKHEQRLMSRKLRTSPGTAGHGPGGLATYFVDVAHNKLKPGGVLALIVPFTVNNGDAWAKVRSLLNDHYHDFQVFSIPSFGKYSRAFSADTGMAESMIVATKGTPDTSKSFCVNVSQRPNDQFSAYSVARSICERRTGTAVLNVIEEDSLGGGGAGVLSSGVFSAARALVSGRLLLPRNDEAWRIPVTRLGTLADRGKYHTNFMAGYAGAAFSTHPIKDDQPAEFPMLWSHDCELEHQLFVQPDRACVPLDGRRSKAVDIWNATASRLHSNRDFRLNSQPLGMCLTPERTLGGRAWPNLMVKDSAYEIPLLLWANSLLGVMMFWLKGTRQQQGRVSISISQLPELPVLDVRKLSKSGQKACQLLFEDLKCREFLPANEAWRDDTRKELDWRLLTEVLELDPRNLPRTGSQLRDGMDQLRTWWCSEPSVHGGENTRPE